jgi:hypothetical protein
MDYFRVSDAHFYEAHHDELGPSIEFRNSLDIGRAKS